MKSRTPTVQEYWDSHADEFRAFYKEPTAFDRVFRKAVYLRAALAVEACSKLDSPTVLDVGSGPGINSVAFIKMGGAAQLTGIDFSEPMNKLARSYAESEGVANRCEFLEGDFMIVPLKPKSFDVSIALGVFDYVDDAQSFLTRMASVTRKVIVASWPEAGLRMSLRKWRYTCLVRPYGEQEVRELHRKAGIPNLEMVRLPGGWVSRGTF